MALRKKLKKNTEISLDEVFLDSKNIPGFDRVRFEGRLEFPLDSKILKIVGSAFLVIFLFLLFKAFDLQIIKADYFQKRSANNFLRSALIAPSRGEIYDRNGEVLAWNEPDAQENFLNRKYSRKKGLSLLLGFTGFDSEASSSALFKSGKDGIEKFYNERLEGAAGVRIMEVNSLGELVSENIRELPKSGENIALTVDARVTSKLYEILQNVSEEKGFGGGAGVIMDVRNGDILALTSFPEYDSEILSNGKPEDVINEYLQDKRKPFLNRAIAGAYTPGSVIKPLIALAALNENIIAPEKVIMTHGSISLPNPYFPEKYTIFRDWKNHGAVDMRRAIAVSSDVYFYTIGGGYEDIKGLGAALIDQYAEMFNFGKKTGIDLLGEKEGVIPYPSLKAKTHPENPVWRTGDTYNISIGQGNFQVTPIQMAVFASSLANKGQILKPRLNKENAPSVVRKVDIPEEYFQIIHDGMKMAVTEGTARALNGLSVQIAAKTGTAEVGKKYVNSWLIGFWPYENPRYSIAVVLERGSPDNLIGGVFTVYHLLSWMSLNTPEYVK